MDFDIDEKILRKIKNRLKVSPTEWNCVLMDPLSKNGESRKVGLSGRISYFKFRVSRIGKRKSGRPSTVLLIE